MGSSFIHLIRTDSNDAAIPLLGIHTEETRSERDTCTPTFIAALFIIAKTWKQPRCPPSSRMDKEAVVHMHYGIKSLLKKVKKESEKVGLKLKIQKTNYTASGPIT